MQAVPRTFLTPPATQFDAHFVGSARDITTAQVVTPINLNKINNLQVPVVSTFLVEMHSVHLLLGASVHVMQSVKVSEHFLHSKVSIYSSYLQADTHRFPV